MYEAVIKTVSNACLCVCWLLLPCARVPIAKLGYRATPVFICHEKDVFLMNIVGAKFIVCTHWLNIVGAAAPTAPMVPKLGSQRIIFGHGIIARSLADSGGGGGNEA